MMLKGKWQRAMIVAGRFAGRELWCDGRPSRALKVGMDNDGNLADLADHRTVRTNVFLTKSPGLPTWILGESIELLPIFADDVEAEEW